jgi:hypothetical protein
VGHLGLNPASFPDGPERAQRQHPVAQITEVVAVDPPTVEVLSEVRESVPDGVDAGEVSWSSAIRCSNLISGSISRSTPGMSSRLKHLMLSLIRSTFGSAGGRAVYRM